jgi:hypothetical protein
VVKANEFKLSWRILRIGLLVLLFAALLGPWVFDAIYMPPKYTCSGRLVRLNEHLCGKPLSGLRILVWVTLGFVRITGAALQGTANGFEWVRELLFCLLLFMPVAPFVTTLLLIQRGHHWRRQVANLVVWALAGAAGLLIVLSYLPGIPPLRSQWGVWLVIGLAGSALALEALILATSRNTSSE